MRIRTGPVTFVLLSLLVAACGITTSRDRGMADEIEAAAEATAALAAYEFRWTADYGLSEVETGRSALTVEGMGVVSGTGDVDAIVDYDEDLRSVTRALFGDDTITQVQAFTRIVDDAIYIRGFHAAALAGDFDPEYDAWYEVSRRSQEVQDPLVRSDVLPADVLPVVVEPLVDAGELSVVVDRDFVLDLGTRFPRSIFDFGLLIGGGDFTLSVVIDEGLIDSLTLDGDDPGSGVERFTFTMAFTPVAAPAIEPPPDAVAIP
jgi:hypothetical protein